MTVMSGIIFWEDNIFSPAIFQADVRGSPCVPADCAHIGTPCRNPALSSIWWGHYGGGAEREGCQIVPHPPWRPYTPYKTHYSFLPWPNKWRTGPEGSTLPAGLQNQNFACMKPPLAPP